MKLRSAARSLARKSAVLFPHRPTSIRLLQTHPEVDFPAALNDNGRKRSNKGNFFLRNERKGGISFILLANNVDF